MGGGGGIRDEILFDDLEGLSSDEGIPSTVKAKRGYAKMVGACIQTAKYRLDYVWIDSCCINQSSSAELSESTNSMYRCAWI